MDVKVHVRKKPGRPLQLYYVDPLTGKDITKSSGTTDLKTARLEAARWQIELEENGIGSNRLSWEAFRRRFQAEHFPNVADSTRRTYRTTLNSFEKHVGLPRDISLIDSSVISKYSAAMHKAKLEPNTIAKNLRHLLAVLGWAKKLGMIKQRPEAIMPRLAGIRRMKGRPISEKEFKTLLRAVLQKLMRHKSIATTMTFYVQHQVDDLAEAIWKSSPPVARVKTVPPAVPLEGQKSEKSKKTTTKKPGKKQAR